MSKRAHLGKSLSSGKLPIPFIVPDETTDVAFLVEEEKLHFNKTLLGMFSPVFKRMFTSDFKEKNADVIPLPGKTLDDMVLFLKQIHPDYCSEAITDETLQKILPLADEYQCEAVRQKCNQYIKHETQLGLLRKTLTNDRLLLYLGLCDKFRLAAEQRSLLLEIAAKRKGTELQKSKSFQSVPVAARADLWAKRCVMVEASLSEVLQIVSPSVEFDDELLGYCSSQVVCRKCTKFETCDSCMRDKVKKCIEKVGGIS